MSDEMRLSVETLGTFYEMARQGAGLAADRLTRMTDVESRVGATRLEFSTPGEVREMLNRRTHHAGTVVDLEGDLEGMTVLLFKESSAQEIARTLVTDIASPSDRLVKSAVVEVCSVMNNGFVDGWADVLHAEIEPSAPEYVAGEALGRLVDERRDDDDGMALLFRSNIETTGREVDFEHFFLPAPSASELFSSEDGIAYGNFAGFDRVAQRGANRVAEDLSDITGMETDVDVRRVSFLALDAIPEAVPNEELASVAFSFDGTPSGYMLFLYSEESARQLVKTMLGSEPGDELGDLGRDALQEASNIMASGLLDGWANVLDTTIDHSTPAFTWDMGAATVDPLVVGLSEDQEFAFVFDTRIEAADAAFDAEVYVIPDEDDLEQALAAVDTSRVEETAVNASEDVDVDEFADEDEADEEIAEDIEWASTE